MGSGARGAVGAAGPGGGAGQHDAGDFPLRRGAVRGGSAQKSGPGGAGQRGGQSAALRAGGGKLHHQVRGGHPSDCGGAPHGARTAAALVGLPPAGVGGAGLFWPAAADRGDAAGPTIFGLQAGAGIGRGDGGGGLRLLSGPQPAGLLAGAGAVHPHPRRLYQRGADRLHRGGLAEQYHLRGHLVWQIAGGGAGAAVCPAGRRALGRHRGHRLRDGGQPGAVPQGAAAGDLRAGGAGGGGLFQPGQIWLRRGLRHDLRGDVRHHRPGSGAAAAVRDADLHCRADAAARPGAERPARQGAAPAGGPVRQERAPADAGAAGGGFPGAAGDCPHHPGGLAAAGQGQSGEFRTGLRQRGGRGLPKVWSENPLLAAGVQRHRQRLQPPDPGAAAERQRVRGGLHLPALGAVYPARAAGPAGERRLSGADQEGGDEPQGGAGALGGDRPV